MLPWFIYLLIQFGSLQTPGEWNTLTPEKQQEFIITYEDLPS